MVTLSNYTNGKILGSDEYLNTFNELDFSEFWCSGNWYSLDTLSLKVQMWIFILLKILFWANKTANTNLFPSIALNFTFLKPFDRIRIFGILPKCIFVFAVDRPNLLLLPKWRKCADQTMKPKKSYFSELKQ